MPKKRTPLTIEEKNIIREWIDNGAHWSLEEIDPAVYVHAQNRDSQLARRPVSYTHLRAHETPEHRGWRGVG